DVPGEGKAMAHQVISLAEHARRSEIKANDILSPGAEKARTAKVEFRTQYSTCNRPWEAIVDAAKLFGCDAIIMASHGRTGISRLMHDSQSLHARTHTHPPTLVGR